MTEPTFEDIHRQRLYGRAPEPTVDEVVVSRIDQITGAEVDRISAERATQVVPVQPDEFTELALIRRTLIEQAQQPQEGVA